MLTVDALREYGANVDEGLNRCMNNEAFYLRLVQMALGDAGFGRLEQAVNDGNLESAFEAAHALKGVLGNLSLTPVFDPVSEVTELLRNKENADYAGYVAQIQEKLAGLKALAE
jgi:HPt (histidine-containing phosphotransfer) domain-containing protein